VRKGKRKGEEEMARLFERTSINGMELENRFVRSATWEGMATDDGICTPRLIDLLVKLASGGVGLIISSHTYVSRAGQAGPWQLGIDRDELTPGLQDMTEAVHRENGKIVLQLAHAGCRAIPELTGQEPAGPSGSKSEADAPYRQMSIDDIRATIEAFASGAARAKASGFDGVQIHAAHGYLLSQFLSPYYNKREDAYGGTLANRARMALEVLQAVRDKVGAEYPVLIKMNSEDFVEKGLSVDEMVRVAAKLEEAGIDAIELSGGTADSGKMIPVRPGRIDSAEKEAFYRDAAARYKEKVSTPLLLVGGFRSYAVAEELVGSGLTDYVSLSRPLIREPHLINRWKSGDTGKSTCLSDNLCFKPIRDGEGMYCYAQAKAKDRG
jgi:2,4-dienoyl-CoA reductase-like NADH-dependent reductase (Old Yellow Enzyme family)